MFIFSECETSEGTEQWFHWPLSTDEEILWACCSRNLPMLTTSIHLGGGDINTKTFFSENKALNTSGCYQRKARTFLFKRERLMWFAGEHTIFKKKELTLLP